MFARKHAALIIYNDCSDIGRFLVCDEGYVQLWWSSDVAHTSSTMLYLHTNVLLMSLSLQCFHARDLQLKMILAECF